MPSHLLGPQRAVDADRRLLLKILAAAGIAGTGLAGGFGGPAFAADAPGWPHDAFKQKSEEEALKALYKAGAQPSGKLALDVPEIAENGAVVPVSISTELPGVTSLAILVLGNPFTLAAYYKIPAGTQANVSCRLKMAKTSKVIAVAEAGGKIYSATKDVKVTLGGCGG